MNPRSRCFFAEVADLESLDYDIIRALYVESGITGSDLHAVFIRVFI